MTETTKGNTCPMCADGMVLVEVPDYIRITRDMAIDACEPLLEGQLTAFGSRQEQQKCDLCEGTGIIYTVSDVRALEEAILSEHYRTETKTVVNYSHIESEFEKLLPTEKGE